MWIVFEKLFFAILHTTLLPRELDGFSTRQEKLCTWSLPGSSDPSFPFHLSFWYSLVILSENPIPSHALALVKSCWVSLTVVCTMLQLNQVDGFWKVLQEHLLQVARKPEARPSASEQGHRSWGWTQSCFFPPSPRPSLYHSLSLFHGHRTLVLRGVEEADVRVLAHWQGAGDGHKGRKYVSKRQPQGALPASPGGSAQPGQWPELLST